MNDKKVIALMVVFIAGVFISGLLYDRYQDEKLEKKIEAIAKDVELIKVDIEALKKVPLKVANSSGKNSGFNDFLSIQKKLSDMKQQISELSKSKAKKTLGDYKAKEERLLREHANNVSKAWSAYLDQRLAASGFSTEDREIIVADYRRMLSSINDEQYKWYNGEMSSEELSVATKVLGRDLYESMVETVGDKKASVALGIIFPDPVIRKSLFEE